LIFFLFSRTNQRDIRDKLREDAEKKVRERKEMAIPVKVPFETDPEDSTGLLCTGKLHAL
jgi:hypothetical protein